MLPELRVGPVRITNVSALVSQTEASSGSDPVLGISELKVLKITLDFPGKMAYVALADGGAGSKSIDISALLSKAIPTRGTGLLTKRHGKTVKVVVVFPNSPGDVAGIIGGS